MIIFAYTQTIKQTDTNLITEAHSNPLWIVGERANYKREDSSRGKSFVCVEKLFE